MNEQELYARAVQEHLAPFDRVYQTAVHTPVQPHPVRRAVAVLAACICTAVLTVACIPAARAAVLRWLSPATDPAAYLSTPEEARATDNPALDAAISDVAPDAVAVTVTDAVNADWQQWADTLDAAFDELLYDGQTLLITGTLTGHADDMQKPLSAYTVTEDETGVTHSPPDDLVCVSARWRLNDGDWVYTLCSALGRPASDGPYLTDDDAPVSDTLPLLVQAGVGAGLTGEQRLTLELLFYDMQTLRQNPLDDPEDLLVSCVALHVDGLRFDATAGTGIREDLPLPQPAALTGDVLVFSGEEAAADGSVVVGNDLLSLDGGSLAVLRMQQQLNGVQLTFCLTLPDAWSDRQCRMFDNSISVAFLLNGEDQGGFGRAYDSMQFYDAQSIGRLGLTDPPQVSAHVIVFSVETLLLPDDRPNIEGLSVVLCSEEMTAYNGVPVPTGARTPIVADPNGWSEDTVQKRFTDCPLPLY